MHRLWDGRHLMKFEIRTIDPEEDLRNHAESIVHGYQCTSLGHRQREMLRNMRVYRDSHPECWGLIYERRKILESLMRRELVEKIYSDCLERRDSWRLTPLGEQVAELLLRA